MTPDELLKTIQWQLGQKVIQFDLGEDDLWVRVAAEDWRRAAEVCRDELNCNYFSFVSALDWLVNPALDGEKAFAAPEHPPEDGQATASTGAEPAVIITDEVQRKAGGSSRFQVFGRLHNVEGGCGLTLTADVDNPELRVPSWVPVYRGADWHERETWEMFGITFEGHPSLRHIYLPEEFEGHPLRKDFPLVARLVRPWPGLVDMEEMPPLEPNGEAS